MRKQLKILTLSNYPTQDPAHGGQHRIANMVSALRDAGHEVEAIGVLGSESYPPQAGFEPYPGMEPLKACIENPFLMEDWAIGKLFAENPEYFSALSAHLQGKDFDVVIVEQPWLFEFAQKCISKFEFGNTKLVYGSQNVEHSLKEDILSFYLDKTAAERGKMLVEEVEKNAILHSHSMICVSEHDLSWALQNGARSVVLAPNGVNERIVTDDGILEANRHSDGRKFALYSASAHPPNMNGFFHYFGGGLGALSPSERLIIAGGAGPAILNDQRFLKAGNLEVSCHSTGLVTETCLAALLHTAHAIVLPIFEGGGTNLKTAEALWTGCHIVGTSVAFRGFEDFQSSEGVRIADTPADFLAALRDAMAAPPLVLDEAERQRRKTVLWSSTLAPLLDHIATL